MNKEELTKELNEYYKQNDKNVSEEDEKKLLFSFNCILNNFYDMCEKSSLEQGKGGINLFMFKSQNESESSQSNCKYTYVSYGSEVWSRLILSYGLCNGNQNPEESNNKQSLPNDSEAIFNKIFNPDTQFVVCVVLPTEKQGGYIGELRILDYGTKEKLLQRQKNDSGKQ